MLVQQFKDAVMTKKNEKYIQVEDFADLVKEKNGDAILNSNVEAYNSFRNKKLKELETAKRLNELDSKMDSILSMLETLTKDKT